MEEYVIFAQGTPKLFDWDAEMAYAKHYPIGTFLYFKTTDPREHQWFITNHKLGFGHNWEKTEPNTVPPEYKAYILLME